MTKRLLLFLIILIPYFSLSQLSDKDKDFLRQELSGLINNLRESKGLKPLIFNDTLRKAAEYHSEYMARYGILSHTEKSSRYRTPKKRVTAFDGKTFETVGENILYTTPQQRPKKRADLTALAEEMFYSWKNSPGHYANMTEPEYVYGDLGFKRDEKKSITYATQVFGTKGYVVLHQLSENSFRLYTDPINCEREFKKYSNRIYNMGNNIEIVGNEVFLYYFSIKGFREIFSGPNDGIAIDLVSKDQLACGKPNQLDYSPIYDGILLKPIYSREMVDNNRAQGDYRLITKVGEIPENLRGNEYSPSLVIIKNGKACQSIYPTKIPFGEYGLRPISSIIKDEPKVRLVKKGIKRSQVVDFNFKTNITSSIAYPTIVKYPNTIHSVHINSYSSVEGDSINNIYLHNSRAVYIQNQIQARLGVPSYKFTSTAKENWEQMDFQLSYFGLDSLARLPHDSLKLFLEDRNDSLAWDSLTWASAAWRTLDWDSLLLSQRKSIAIINYVDNYSSGKNQETLGEFNLRTAVATRNIPLLNKALYEMYQSSDYNPSILFEYQINEFIKTQPKAVGNYTALLSKNYYYNPYFITEFIHSWLNRIEELDNDARFNLMSLYTLVGTHLLNNWDVSSQRLSKVIHPSKINKINVTNAQSELVLNQHLTFIKYYGQINDGPNIYKSFNYIADHFKSHEFKQDDDVNLGLFFNKWGALKLTVEYLLDHFKNDNLNEDGFFLLARTMSLLSDYNISDSYIEVNEKALGSNQIRWCEWVEDNFQVKRNYQIKRMYCEVCE